MNDWSDPVWHNGSLWRKHFETDYWVQVDPNGDLLHEEDVDWFLWSGFDLPPKPPIRLTPKRPGPYTRHGKMETIPEEPANTPGAASSGDPIGGESSLPAQGSAVSELQAALCNLQKCLQMSNRWDSRSFRAQLKRTIRRLCFREKIDLPVWWDNVGLSTHQYKFKCHDFVNELLNARLVQAGAQAVSGLPENGTGAEPTSPTDTEEEEEKKEEDKQEPAAPTAPAEPIQPSGPGTGLPANGTDLQGPSAVRMAFHILENMLGDMENRHPGLRDEVYKIYGSPRLPVPSQETPAAAASTGPTTGVPTIPPLDLQGLPASGNNSNANPSSPMQVTSPGSTSSSTHFASDNRKVKSEPPQSPRQDLLADAIMEPNVTIPGLDGLPEKGAPVPGPVEETLQAGTGMDSTNAVPDPPTLPIHGPEGLPANGSWVVADPVPVPHADGWSDVGTTASFEVVEERVDMDDL